MNGLALLLSLVPFCLARQHAPEFVAWSNDTSQFLEYTIPNADLVPEQIQHELDASLLLDTPFEIILSRGSASSYPTAVKSFFDVFSTVNTSGTNIRFPSGRVLYEFLRVLNGLEHSHQPGQTFEALCTRAIAVYSMSNINHTEIAELNVWANGVLQALCPDVPNPIVDEASLEWIFRMKVANDPAIHARLTATGTKILFWAHQKRDALSKQLGMKYDRSTASYTGKNVLGKLWMRIRDNKVPLCMEQWMADFEGAERIIHINDLRTQNFIVHTVDGTRSPFHVDPVRLSARNPLVPADIRRIISNSDRMAFERVFHGAGHLIQYIRLIRYYQAAGLADEDVMRLVRDGHIDHNSYSYTAVCNRATGLMRANPTFNTSSDDVEWILRLSLAQSQNLQATLHVTDDKFILAVGCGHYGMVREEGANGVSFKGKNIAGKVWTKIRNEMTRPSQGSANVRPSSSHAITPVCLSPVVNSAQPASTNAVNAPRAQPARPEQQQRTVQQQSPQPAAAPRTQPISTSRIGQETVPRPGPGLLDIYNSVNVPGQTVSPLLAIYQRANNPTPVAETPPTPESQPVTASNRANNPHPPIVNSNAASSQATNSRTISAPSQASARQQAIRNVVARSSPLPNAESVATRLAAIRAEEARIQTSVDRLTAELNLANARLAELRLEASRLASPSTSS